MSQMSLERVASRAAELAHSVEVDNVAPLGHLLLELVADLVLVEHQRVHILILSWQCSRLSNSMHGRLVKWDAERSKLQGREEDTDRS